MTDRPASPSPARRTTWSSVCQRFIGTDVALTLTTAVNENKWCMVLEGRKSVGRPHHVTPEHGVRTGAALSCKRYDRSSRGVISGAFRLSFAFIRRTNYSSCHGCSFVDGVFIPWRKSPITSRENCLSLQEPAGRGRWRRDNATRTSSAARAHRCVNYCWVKKHPFNGTSNQPPAGASVYSNAAWRILRICSEEWNEWQTVHHAFGGLKDTGEVLIHGHTIGNMMAMTGIIKVDNKTAIAMTV